MFSLICLEAVILTLAILVKRKIWPLFSKSPHRSLKTVLLTIFVAEEVFFIHHMFQVEMWHILSHSQYSIAMNFTQNHTRALLTISVLHLTAMLYTQLHSKKTAFQKNILANRKIKV